MTHRKKIIFVVLVIVVLLILMSGKKTPTTQTPPTGARSYDLGIGYFPLNPIYNSKQAMAKIADTADIAYIQRHWQESQNPNGQDFFTTIGGDISEARNNGLKVYVAFEILNPDRSKLELPKGMSGDLGSSAVRSAYVSLVKKVAGVYKPDYFILNVEANTYKHYNPADFASYQSLYDEAYNVAKQVSPKTKIGVSLLYTDKDNHACIDKPDRTLLLRDSTDFSKGDIFAVSFYPMCYINSSNFPNTFFSTLATLSTKPLFISETGWASEGVGGIGSEANQAGYIKSLFRAADYAINQGAHIEAINYVGLVDPSKEVCDFVVALEPSLSWYCNLSLIRLDGVPKPAYAEFKAWEAARH